VTRAKTTASTRTKRKATASKAAKIATPSSRAAEMAKGRLSLAAHYAKQHAPTADAVEAAVRRAWPALQRKTRGETLYAFALYTSGTALFSYVGISANTEEGLSEVASEYLTRHSGSTLERERDSLRWNACDWAHHDFAPVPRVAISKNLGIRSRFEDAAIWSAFALGLSRCDDAGLFGRGDARERVTLAILCGDMDARFFMKGVRRLNPSRVASRAQREWRKQFAEAGS
jgi:Domain of unknown function (DUF4303)